MLFDDLDPRIQAMVREHVVLHKAMSTQIDAREEEVAVLDVDIGLVGKDARMRDVYDSYCPLLIALRASRTKAWERVRELVAEISSSVAQREAMHAACCHYFEEATSK
jgi:hypothetical protein